MQAYAREYKQCAYAQKKQSKKKHIRANPFFNLLPCILLPLPLPHSMTHSFSRALEASLSACVRACVRGVHVCVWVRVIRMYV